MRTRLLIAALTVLLAVGLTPAGAFVLPQQSTFATPNMTPVGLLPDVAAISTQFASDEPIMYVSTLHGIDIFDISDPRLPVPLGGIPMAFFQNEAMTLGERADGTKFVLVGVDLYQVSPTAMDANVTGSEVIVIDVTDPSSPEITAILEVATSTHTMTCANAECTHAYTAGSASQFEIVELIDIHEPKVVNTLASVAGPGLQGHDWDLDEAGLAWHVGGAGAAVYDVSDPADPVLLNSTSAAGRQNATDYNNFILHNSIRPDADLFESRDDSEVIGLRDSPRAQRGLHEREVTPDDIRPGEVLLVTEEDYIDATCEAEGAFSTWHVQQLDPSINPDEEPGAGTIAPLAKWNTEILDTGVKTPAGAFCSAHYFDYHQDGFVAQGWYQQGLRLLDVRDPLEIKQVGYWITVAQETWGAYWVPEYDEDGQTGQKTNLLYTNDPTRGLEILEVDLPDTEAAATQAVRAPILPQWLTPDLTLEARKSDTWGYLCPLI